ncbi:hypothetical protein ACFZAM_31855 [Streptomyces sp. NPDC008079]|uniref:hypothetical protein n=1 Tax=Streptomyces sp. NPDC008079 TaxID=3364806 RepID=UPI0036F1296F
MARSVVRTWKNRETGKETNRITIRVEHRLKLGELVDGLCSSYARNAVSGELELPPSLSPGRILEAVREEYEEHGFVNVWTWSESTGVDEEECRQWALGLILATFPEMAENQ